MRDCRHFRRDVINQTALTLATDSVKQVREQYKEQAYRVLFLLIGTTFSAIFAVWWCMGGNTSSTMANPVVISASAKHTATVIFLHGLGDTGNGWSQAISGIRDNHIKYVCPTAPHMPVTLNAGFKMPSWFDILALSSDGPEDEAGIKKAAEIVHQLIAEEEKHGIPSHRIALGGFSQGGALALYAALTTTKPLAGIVMLSSWMPLHSHFPAAIKGNHGAPTLQCHGNCDPIVPFVWGQKTADLLRTLNKNHTFKSYSGMAHSACDEEMKDMKEFLNNILPPL